MNRIAACCTIGLLCAASVASAQNAELVLGGGLLFSPDYGEYIEDVYDSVGYYDASGSGWLDLYGGVEIAVDDQVGILVGCDALFNAVDVSGGPLDETYANAVLVPSVYGQFYFMPERQVYINAGLGLPLPGTGSDYFELENNGLALGANMGVRFAEILRVEAGISYIPVEAKATSKNTVWAGSEQYNFGGFQIRALLSF